MREIKFRAWDKEYKKMCSISSLGITHKTVIDDWDEGKFGRYVFNDGIEIMQYTGLLDKNGNEIYEGDIIQFNGWLKEGKRIGFVEWWNNVARWGVNIPKEFDPSEDLSARCVYETYEIIGNIYENPELLEGK